MRSLIIVIFSFFIVPKLVSQDFSNKGREFWVGYGSHCSMYGTGGVVVPSGGAQDMVLYFTSDKDATVTVDIPAIGWTRTYTVTANQVTTSALIPKAGSQDARITDEGKSNKGIHITSDVPIIAYAHVYNSSISGATLLFPVTTLGREYYSLNFTQISNDVNGYCYAYVIATEDDTNIEIILSANSFNNNAGDTIKVNLNKGEIYNVFGRKVSSVGNTHTGTDLTGTKIRSVATATSACKKIAVFSGSGKLSITCTANSGSADNYMQQSFPSTAWGKKYLLAPTKDMPNNYYRIAVSKPGAVVKRNGVALTGLVNGFYYQFFSNSADLIESDEQIMVAQYVSTASSCGNTKIGGNGDPEMIYLSPIEQTIEKVTINSTPNAKIINHYVNIIIPKGGFKSLTIDGIPLSIDSVTVHPGDNSYYYMQLWMKSGSHTIQSDSGFNAIAYGFGSAESYGYNAGCNVKDQYQELYTNNKLAVVKMPATCKGTPFEVAITLPYEPLSIKWSLPNYPAIPQENYPTYDSTWVKNGKTVYKYSLPGNYVYWNTGTYTIQVLVNNPTADGCSGEQTIDFQLEVYDRPKASWNYTTSNCVTDSLAFIENSVSTGRPIVGYAWDMGDGNYQTSKSFNYKYQFSGVYNVKYYAFTDIGCVSDTVSQNVILDSVPIADFKILDSLCQNKSINLLDNSSAPGGGSIAKRWWKSSDGMTAQNLTSFGYSFTTTGAYSISLQVQSGNGCLSPITTKWMNIYPNPVVDFDLPQICLPNGSGTFLDKSTIVDASESTFKRKWIFGDPLATNINPDTALNIVNPSHSYYNVGPFNVKLIVTSEHGCIDSTTKVLSTIYQQPKTNFDIQSEICLRQQSIFTDKTDAKGRTMTTWNWSFSNGATSTLQNPKITFTGAGTYSATLIGYTKDGCTSDTVTKTFIIHPLPTADFNISNPLCETKVVTFTQNATANVGSITRWNWTLGTGATPINFTSASSSVTKTFAVWGDQIIKLVVENSKGCISDTLIRTYRIHPKPTLDFPLPEVCLSDAFAPFTAVYTIADNSIGETFTWNFSDPNATPVNPNIGNGYNISHKYSAAANYAVSLSVITAAGCSNSITKTVTVNGATPNAIFDVLNETSLCSNTDVSIKNLSLVDFGAVTKLEIFWDYDNDPSNVFVDDNPTLNKIYKHLYTNFQSPALKNYTIRLRAYSGGVCFDDTLRTINLNGSPLVNFQTLPGICLESSPRQITQATYTDVTGITSGVEAYTGTGVSITGLFSPSISGAGTFPIKYTFTSSNSCTINTSQNITVWPRPTADFSVAVTQCEKTPLTFTNKSLANAGSITTWNWNFGDGTAPFVANNGNTFNHTYTNFGSYTTTLDVLTNNGCTSIPKTISVIVNPLPIVQFDMPKVCLPSGRALFSNRTTSPNGSSLTYLWNFGDPLDPSASVSTDGLHYYKNYQTYNVKLTATSSQGCTNNLTQTLVDVFPQPKAGIKSVDSVCVGTAINYFDTSKGFIRPITQWYWNFADGNTETIKDPIYKHLNSGTYKISLSVVTSEGCPSDTAYKTLTIHPYPIVNAGPDMYVLDDGQKLISAQATGSGLSFKWTPSTYLTASNILQPTILFPQQDMIYTLTVSGRGGCTKSDEMAIKVLKMPKPPNTFTPNGDGINDTWDVIYLDQYPGCIVEVYNAQGQIVFRTEEGYTKKWDGTFKGSPLPSGTYYYVIDPKNGRNKMAGYVTIFK